MRVWVWLVWFGCAPPAEDVQFAQDMSSAMCARIKACDRGQFSSDYFGMKDCRRSQEAELLEGLDEQAENGCALDTDEAADTVSDVKDMDCERFYEAAYVEAQLLDAIWIDCEGEEG